MGAVTTDDKNPVEQALDVLLYAPLGLVFSAGELFPKLVEKGRSQIGMAKMLGQFAVQQGQTEATKVFDRASKQAMTTLEQLAGRPSSNGSSSSSSSNGSAPAKASNGRAPATATVAPITSAPSAVADLHAVAAEAAAAVPHSGPEAAELAIPDYDSLSASQVLPRLTGLSTEELEAVRTYEAAHRGRKTILNRVSQLQA
jgi:cytoskeletal protein RodZ